MTAVGSYDQVPESLNGALGPWIIASVCRGYEGTQAADCV